MSNFRFLLFVWALMPGVSFGQHAVATYRMPIDDRGILISPSEPGERYYESDGRGMREPNIYKVGGDCHFYGEFRSFFFPFSFSYGLWFHCNFQYQGFR